MEDNIYLFISDIQEIGDEKKWNKEIMCTNRQ